jgi:iron complex transport system substrate-binding protein
MLRREALIAGASLALAGGAPAPAPARRVVSLNPCLDAMLVAVAAPGQIAALSHYSQAPSSSSIGALARRHPFTYESAEEVIAFSPDLVVASRHSSLATRQALKQLGIPVMLFATPDTMEESLDQMVRIAAAVGRRAGGEARARRIRTTVAASAPPPGWRPVRALVFQRGGFSSGPDTLMNELLEATGFVNAAVGYGLKRTSNVPLEQVIADPPDVLLQGEATPGAPGWGERVMRHPALSRVSHRMRIAAFPEKYMYCGGPNLEQSAPLLADVRRRLQDGRL